MVKPKSKIIKTEVVSEEEDLDCFGNYDVKELLTCQVCALKSDCSVVTEKIKSERFNFRPRLKQLVDKTKEKLEESPQVVELVSKIKIKQKKLEHKMKVDKIKSKKSSTEEGSTKTKVLKKKSADADEKPSKKVKSSDSEEKTEKKAGRPKVKSDIETLGKSTLPTTFKTLYKGIKEMGTPDYKDSVTNIRGESGILFCVPIAGRSTEKVEIFVNRSGGYKFKDFKYVEEKTSKKGGETVLVVKATQKSMDEALEKLGQWKKDQAKHLAANSGKRASKKTSGDEKKTKKTVKEDKTEKTGKKLVKKEKVEEKPSKKTAPVIKPSKKKAVVEDEEG